MTSETTISGTITWNEINGIGTLTCDWEDGTKETVGHDEPINAGTDSHSIAAMFGCDECDHDGEFVHVAKPAGLK